MVVVAIKQVIRVRVVQEVVVMPQKATALLTPEAVEQNAATAVLE